jgi:hypothetical protein
VVRDWAFLFYQVNAIFGMGLVGGPLVLWLAYRAIRRQQQPKPARPPDRRKRKAVMAPAPRPRPAAIAERQFWMILILAGLVLGVAVVGERDPLGVGHLTLLALQMLGITMLAAVIPWRRRTTLAIVILAGCTVDFSLGVLLQARVESLDNSPGSIVFPGMEFSGGQIQTAAPGPGVLSNSAWNNWFVKHQIAAYYWWSRALEAQYGRDPAFQAIRPQLEAGIAKARSDDATSWQGWFDRNGGEVEFLGDHVAGASGAGTNIATALLLALLITGTGYITSKLNGDP